MRHLRFVLASLVMIGPLLTVSAPASGVEDVDSIPISLVVQRSPDNLYGRTANISVATSAGPFARFVVTATQFDGTRFVLFDGYAQSPLVLSRDFDHTVMINASASVDYASGYAAAEFMVTPLLRTKPVNPLRVTRNGTAIYARTSDPRFRATSSPARPGACLRFQVQRENRYGWRTLKMSRCQRMDAQSISRWRLYGRQPVGVTLRVRSWFWGDELNGWSQSAWRRFRFR